MEEIENALTATLKNTDLQGLNVDLGEIAIDVLMQDGILKEIPIIKTVLALKDFGSNVQKRFFLIKVFGFISNLEGTSIEERQAFIDRIERDEGYNKKVVDAVLLILDRYYDFDKPKILGKLLKACVKNKIDYKTFLRLSYFLDNLFIPDLEYLRRIKLGEAVEAIHKEELYKAGYMSRTIFGQVQVDGNNEYYINEYGKQTLDIIDGN